MKANIQRALPLNVRYAVIDKKYISFLAFDVSGGRIGIRPIPCSQVIFVGHHQYPIEKMFCFI